MGALADQLSLHLEVHVADFTGLQGDHEVSLEGRPADGCQRPRPFAALDHGLHGLGLDLKRGTVPVKVVVVDSVSKMPTPN